ncbi:hypothetical protein D3C78_1308300 [compost metagenome]
MDSSNSRANTSSSTAPAVLPRPALRGMGAGMGKDLSSHMPASPAAPMAATWPSAEGMASASRAAAIARPARSLSGHRVLAMPQTACATTATAASFSPCTAPDWASQLHCCMPKANRMSSMADGRVKPSQAAKAPVQPARPRPSAKPTWLLAGPGRNWHSATRSA